MLMGRHDYLYLISPPDQAEQGKTSIDMDVKEVKGKSPLSMLLSDVMTTSQTRSYIASMTEIYFKALLNSSSQYSFVNAPHSATYIRMITCALRNAPLVEDRLSSRTDPL
jgi:hypothetical protein